MKWVRTLTSNSKGTKFPGHQRFQITNSEFKTVPYLEIQVLKTFELMSQSHTQLAGLYTILTGCEALLTSCPSAVWILCLVIFFAQRQFLKLQINIQCCIWSHFHISCLFLESHWGKKVSISWNVSVFSDWLLTFKCCVSRGWSGRHELDFVFLTSLVVETEYLEHWEKFETWWAVFPHRAVRIVIGDSLLIEF